MFGDGHDVSHHQRGHVVPAGVGDVVAGARRGVDCNDIQCINDIVSMICGQKRKQEQTLFNDLRQKLTKRMKKMADHKEGL